MYEDRDTTGNRDKWDFEFLGSALIKPCQKRLDYHKKREDHWTKEAKATEDQIRAKGVSLEERGITGGVRFEARVDTVLGERLGEQRGKLEKHRKLREQYEGFAHEFERTPNRTFALKISDMRFFGIVGGDTVFGEETLS